MLFTLTALVAILSIQFTNAEISLTCRPLNRTQLTAQVTSMFDHAYTAYEQNAFPADELNPLSCSSSQSFGGLSVSLIDTLDSFIVFRQWRRFADAVQYISENHTFAINETISVFETTIRVLGGLLSAHGFLVDPSPDVGFHPEKWCPHYDGALLRLAQDLADRMMPAFDTPTGIPYGSINLVHGVADTESLIASTAGAGSLILEFGTLSRYVGDPKYYEAAFGAMVALHTRASRAGLVGNHIDIVNGNWVATDAGVGGLVDSFYEYMLKGYILFGDRRLLEMFRVSYQAIKSFLHKRPWYLDADMWTGHTSSLSHSSLAAFWPGLQVLYGDIESAVETARAHYSVWRKYGCLPEGYHVVEHQPMVRQINYPLRPELVESVFYLHWATNDSSWIAVAASMMNSIEELTKVKCGYASIVNVSSQVLEDHMPSFVMSETFKYMYLVFAGEDDTGKPHWSRNGEYVFTTEAHPLRIAEDDIRNVLGLRFDEAGTGDDSNLELQVKSSVKKCKRGANLESKLPCGYSMPGTDYPKMSVASITDPANNFGITPDIARNVTKEIQKRTLKNGDQGVNVGEVILGDGWACRIVKIEGHVVSFERLDEAEAQWARYHHEVMQELSRIQAEHAGLRRRHTTCRRGSALDLFREVAMCWRAWDSPVSYTRWP